MEQQRFVRKNTAIIDTARRQDKKRNRRTVFYIFLFLFVSLIFLGVCVAVFLNVETVNINGNERYSYEEILEHVPIEFGENIYSFDADEIEESIKQALPYIGNVEIKRDLPDTVEITVIEEKAYYSAYLAGDTYILSSNLKVLECIPNKKDENTQLVPIAINNVRRCFVGNQVEFVNERNLAALSSLYDGFESVGIQNKIKRVDFTSRFDITINYDDRFEVYIGDTDNINHKMQFLVGVIEKLDESNPGKKGWIDVSNPQEAAVSLS